MIPGPPIPKARARIFWRNGHAQAYDPQNRQKQQVIKLLRSEKYKIDKNAFNFDSVEFFELLVCFYMPIPDSNTLAQKNAKLWGFDQHTKKPDLSNMLKFYEDCANGILWPDDAMITRCMMFKQYDTNPRTEIIIMPGKSDVSDLDQSVLSLFDPQDVDDIFLLLNGDYTDHEKSQYLIEFSLKYADKLRKIKKIVEKQQKIGQN